MTTWKNTRDWLETLVAFDTTSRNSNLALIEDVAGYLRQHGISATILKSPDGTKANLFGLSFITLTFVKCRAASAAIAAGS